jgi:transcriptional regulator with XRE-family HTH domain
MAEIAHSVNLDLPAKLQDRAYRQKFFLAESSARIAAQLIALRKRRGLNQQQVAEMIGTRQPAISRVEQADYQNWSFNSLRSIADALDARIRVIIQPAEDVLKEYDRAEESVEDDEVAALAESSTSVSFHNLNRLVWFHPQGGFLRNLIESSRPQSQVFREYFLAKRNAEQEELARLRDENNRLRDENNRLRSALMAVPITQEQIQTPRQDMTTNPIIQIIPQLNQIA